MVTRSEGITIVDLDRSLEEAWLVCLEPWSPEAVAGRDAKRAWYAAMKDRGLLVKLALEGGEPVGMIQCVPIEATAIVGERLYFIQCIWVHGHPQGVGDRQGRGIGRALLAAAEREAWRRGALGVVAWGLALPIWMRAGWFARQGYRRVARQGMAVLLLKAFAAGVPEPRWPERGPPPPPRPGDPRPHVTCFSSGWCTAQNAACEHARRAAARFGDAVTFERVDTGDPAQARRCGQSDALFVDRSEVRTGPPPSEAKLVRLIRRRVEARGGGGGVVNARARRRRRGVSRRSPAASR